MGTPLMSFTLSAVRVPVTNATAVGSPYGFGKHQASHEANDA
jgi:hypothetical protein